MGKDRQRIHVETRWLEDCKDCFQLELLKKQLTLPTLSKEKLALLTSEQLIQIIEKACVLRIAEECIDLLYEMNRRIVERSTDFMYYFPSKVRWVKLGLLLRRSEQYERDPCWVAMKALHDSAGGRTSIDCFIFCRVNFIDPDTLSTAPAA